MRKTHRRRRNVAALKAFQNKSAPVNPAPAANEATGERIELASYLKDLMQRIAGGEEKAEKYLRLLRSGTPGTFAVIDAAANDQRADRALRHHIADLIDRGEQLPTQLRAYAVRYMLNPLEILRRRDA